MAGLRFDALARVWGGGATRRAMLMLAAAGVSALGAPGVGALPGADEAGAKQGGNKGKKQKRRRRRCKLGNLRGKACESDKGCCASKKYVCGIPFGGAETDPEECCGSVGAPCEFPSDCCAGFGCPIGGGACAEVKEM